MAFTVLRTLTSDAAFIVKTKKYKTKTLDAKGEERQIAIPLLVQRPTRALASSSAANRPHAASPALGRAASFGS
jgi:hypothetical protein